MHILSILFFAIASSSDNFVIGLSYGIKNIKINISSNLIVALISGLGTFGAMILGKLFYNLISPNIANIIGSIILVLFGVYMLINSFKKNKEYNSNISELEHRSIPEIDYYENVFKNPEIIDTDNSKTIEFKEAIMLGFVLSLNNVGLGIGASITGLNIYITALFSFIFSIIFVQLGCHIGGEFLCDKLSKYADLISAIIIIILGIYELYI